ncbi:unnamed protein product [Malus baccata var. baccata]
MAFELAYSFCFLLLLLQLPFYTFAQPPMNITLGSSLIAQDSNSFWASPSGDFAFGFRKIGDNGGFLLAIWFDKIPEKTIVWSANGNSLVAKGSAVQLTEDGQFMLSDFATRRQVSIASSSGTGVSHAAMLDNGNFVLANGNSINSWESFDHPTDTILPAQTLHQGSILFAPYTQTNYSKGRFQFTLQTDGNAVLYTTYFPLDTPNSAYWSTLTQGSGFQVIFNLSGFIYVTARDGSMLYMISPSTVSIQDYYQRATLEYDGVFRHYIYPKSSTNSSVKRAWSALSLTPLNICTVILEGTGGGACGFNSLCRNDDGGPSCHCPYGYTYVDPNDVLKGCKQNFTSQRCDDAALETDLFYLQEMLNTDWAYSANYEYFQPVTEDWCRQTCLGDCFCGIAFYKNKTCWKKSIPLSNGRIDPSVDWKALIKIRIDNSTSRQAGQDSTKKSSSASVVHGLVFMVIGMLVVFLMLAVTFFVVCRNYFIKPKVSQLSPFIQGINLRCFTYMELKEATNGFMEELGRGAFGTVFKGAFASDNGKFVAVKRLDTMFREGDHPEFKAEVSGIGRTNHRNLVQLLGFCDEGHHRILVYEFMSNGSLNSFLFGERSRLHWYLRRQIALGIARGLLYLHEDCSSQIIHCDIKPENILLDDSFTARIADFGLAKLLKADQTQTITAIRGTKGYVAPEWLTSLPVTVKVDVYSFGILLLEIICCRKNFEEAKDEKEMVLADWAFNCYDQRKLHLLLENDEEAKDNIKEMAKYVTIALWCIQQDPSLRPTMKDVTHILEGTVEISIPVLKPSS